jgi:hypothetical protein
MVFESKVIPNAVPYFDEVVGDSWGKQGDYSQNPVSEFHKKGCQENNSASTRLCGSFPPASPA